MINPLYCYEGGQVSFKALSQGSSPVKVDRAAIIVNRGWIPAERRDKRSRPTQNSRKLVRMFGTFRRGKDIHDYKVPNNPDNNEWNNLALEDIARYWDLPNFSECKYYYFHAVDVGGFPSVEEEGSHVEVDSADDIINDHYKWRWHESRNQNLFRVFGSLSAVSLAVAALAI